MAVFTFSIFNQFLFRNFLIYIFFSSLINFILCRMYVVFIFKLSLQIGYFTHKKNNLIYILAESFILIIVNFVLKYLSVQ